MLTKNKLAIVAVLIGLAFSVTGAQAQPVFDRTQTVVDRQGASVKRSIDRDGPNRREIQKWGLLGP